MASTARSSVGPRWRNTGGRWTTATRLMARASCRLAGHHPFLAGDLAVAHHRHRAVELAPAHDAFPHQLAVLRAFGLGLEGERVARRRGGVRAVAVAVAIAGGGLEAAVAEDQRVGVARGLSDLEHHAVEAPAVEGSGGGVGHGSLLEGRQVPPCWGRPTFDTMGRIAYGTARGAEWPRTCLYSEGKRWKTSTWASTNCGRRSTRWAPSARAAAVAPISRCAACSACRGWSPRSSPPCRCATSTPATAASSATAPAPSRRVRSTCSIATSTNIRSCATTAAT